MSDWKSNFYKKFVKPYEQYEILAADKIKKLYNQNIENLLNPDNGNKYDFTCNNLYKTII